MAACLSQLLNGCVPFIVSKVLGGFETMEQQINHLRLFRMCSMGVLCFSDGRVSIPDCKGHVYFEDRAHKLVARDGFSVDDAKADRLPSGSGRPSSILQQGAIAYPRLGFCYWSMVVSMEIQVDSTGRCGMSLNNSHLCPQGRMWSADKQRHATPGSRSPDCK